MAEFVSPSAKLTIKFQGGNMNVTGINDETAASDVSDFLDKVLPTTSLVFKGAQKTVTTNLSV